MENVNVYAFDLKHASYHRKFLIIANEKSKALAWLQDYMRKKQDDARYIDMDGQEHISWVWQDCNIKETGIQDDTFDLVVLDD